MSSLCNNLLQLQQQPLEPRTYNVKCLCLKWDRVQYIHIINVMVKQQPAATATARLSLSSNLLQHQQQPVAHTHAHTHTHTYTHTHTQLTTAQCSKQLPASKNLRYYYNLSSLLLISQDKQKGEDTNACLFCWDQPEAPQQWRWAALWLPQTRGPAHESCAPLHPCVLPQHHHCCHCAPPQEGCWWWWSWWWW